MDIEIVLIEDDANDAELAFRAFKKNQLINQIQWLKNGEEALDYFLNPDNEDSAGSTNPQLILLDIALPKVDGKEVLRQIQQNSSTASIPVVVLIGSESEKEMIDWPGCRIDSFIVKPINFLKFNDTVKEIGLHWALKE
ncbi:MAG: response regulator [Cyclobacteriaceae bacterium]|nr:response regulator [Cyclobacteriaceae bacterium]